MYFLIALIAIGYSWFHIKRMLAPVAGQAACRGIQYLTRYDELKRKGRLQGAYSAIASVDGTVPPSVAQADEPPPLPTEARWYYDAGGKRIGPVSISDIRGLVSGGTLKPDVLIWRKGLTDWQPFSKTDGQ